MGSARIKADRAREVLEWKPERGEAEFLEEVRDVFLEMVEQGESE